MASINLRHMSLALFATLILYVALTFHHYGISNDELVQHVYGRLLLDFYSSGFTDMSAFEYKNLYLYGGFFDLMAASVERILNIPAESLWLWDMRHLLSAIFGLLGIFAVYKSAKLLGGERAGLTAALLLSITAAWSGAMYTHTKDVPFATCMAWALYYTMLISRELPKPSLKLSIKLGIAVGCALGLRIGAGFEVIYLLLLLVVAGMMQAHGLIPRLRYWALCVKHLIPAGITAFILMAIFWPWGVMSPEHPLEAIKSFSHFSFDMLTVMDGEVMSIGAVPRDYLLAYLFVRLPELFLLALGGLLLFAWQGLKAEKPSQQALLLWFTPIVAVAFPLLFIMIDRPALYNGIRHFTFLLPPLAILAGIGWLAYWDALENWRKSRAAFVMVSLALALTTVSTLIRLHPYEYIYYNALAGNMMEAESEWEGDYWSSSLREAADMLEEKVPESKKGIGPTHLVAVCAESIQGDAYLDDRFEITKNWIKADFFISTTNMNCDQVLRGQVIAKVERMGVILAVVKDRRSLADKDRLPRRAPAHMRQK